MHVRVPRRRHCLKIPLEARGLCRGVGRSRAEWVGIVGGQMQNTRYTQCKLLMEIYNQIFVKLDVAKINLHEPRVLVPFGLS